MMKLSLFSALLFWMAACNSSLDETQTTFRLVGGPCEGCEAVLEYNDQSLQAVDTLPYFQEAAEPIKVQGRVYQPDGKTPAPNVILYVYHTDQNGLYSTKGKATDWAQQHGDRRGWLKTDINGMYTFYTSMPVAYPNQSIPAHIHLTILEPNGKYYWAQSYHFEGDSMLTQKETAPTAPRAGSIGLLSLQKEKGIWVGERDFVLGENIPDYK